MMAQITYRAGVDIGGTFTDVVLMASDGSIHTKKLSSTPDDYGRAIVDGLQAILGELGATAGQVEELVHATTVATNTVLEGKGAKTALVTTRGFRDVLELARLRFPVLYDLNYAKPAPLVPRRFRFEVGERLLSSGAVDMPVDRASVRDVANAIRDAGIEAVAISLLHSYANPAHEIEVRDMLRAELGNGLYFTCSHEILPEIREYERTSTTVVNAYLGPVVVGYLSSLLAKLRGIGMMGPLRVMHSNGGVLTAEIVMEKPATIIESGPAAGVIAGAYVASASGYPDCITIDMGGTTAKAAMIEGGEPARTTEYEVGAGINVSSKLVKGGGHAVKLPFIDVSEIGAGGGSQVRIDAGGLIQVGPESAGSVPGPVCYDAGGEIPTLTDAAATLGYINPNYLAGGDLPLKADKSREAIQRLIASPLQLDLLDAAFGIFSIAAGTMTRAVKAVSTFCGRDPRDFALFAFGGNGPVIAHAIAGMMDMKTVLIPPNPGVFSAMGLLFSSTQHEYMRTLFTRLDNISPSGLRDHFDALADRAHQALLSEGAAASDIEIDYALDLRYEDQAYELTVPISAVNKAALDIDAIVDSFHREHERTYGHFTTLDKVELVNLRAYGKLRSQGERRYDARRMARDGGGASPGEPVTRMAYFGKEVGLVETPVVPRSVLAETRPGPLIVEEYDATCVVPPGATARLDAHQNIEIRIGA
ncbi:hydantoinase/oxoprolinase family protein [Sphingomonas sp. YL-JM2C]